MADIATTKVRSTNEVHEGVGIEEGDKTHWTREKIANRQPS